MSFETDKARLIKELADAQTTIRAQFGLKARPDTLRPDGGEAKAATSGRRSSTSSS